MEGPRVMRDLIEVPTRQKTAGAQLPLLLQITPIYAGRRIMCAVGARCEGGSSGIARLYGSVPSQQLHLWRWMRGAARRRARNKAAKPSDRP